jgi:hypothetical protein
LDTLITPPTEFKFEHEASVPPDEMRVTVTLVVELTLLAESSTSKIGWVVRAKPDAPATGWVDQTS